MKQHQIRELVNELRDTALKYYNHQSLREHIANKIIPVLEELDQSKVLEHYRDMLEEQKLIIRALKGTCGDMGTTDMFTALIRKDARIRELEEDLTSYKAMDAALNKAPTPKQEFNYLVEYCAQLCENHWDVESAAAAIRRIKQ